MFANILLSVIVSALTLVGLYNYVPLSVLEKVPFAPKPEQMFGDISITTILGTDTLSGSRSVINTNFSNLNVGKMDTATTSVAGITTLENLVSVGTITTGTWNATALSVAKGGTGTTSPTLNQIMLGNGASGFKVIGFGSSGQFLTSGGDATAPSWTTAAVDQAGNYNWTGLHIFSNKFRITSTTSIEYATTSIRGVEMGWPLGGPTATTTIASSSAMFLAGTNVGSTTNQTAQLNWAYPDWVLLGEFITSTASNTVTISSLPNRKYLKVIVDILGQDATTPTKPMMRFNLDAGANYGYTVSQDSAAGTASSTKGAIELEASGAAAATTPKSCTINISNRTTIAKTFTWECSSMTGAVSAVMTHGGGAWNNTSAAISAISITLGTQGGVSSNFSSGFRLSVYGSKD